MCACWLLEILLFCSHSSIYYLFISGVLEISGAGETLPVAVDMAARCALLNHWKLTSEFKFPFGSQAFAIRLADFQSPNYLLKTKCQSQ